MTERDVVLADERWEFDDEVADAFEDMLSRSIPGYGEMRTVVTELASRFLSHAPSKAKVVDLGASRGEALAQLLALDPDLTGLAIEMAPSMLAACERRLARYPNASVIPLDLRRDYPAMARVDVVLSILTLQFVPIEYRYGILEHVYRSLKDGGALVLVEKILASSAAGDRLLVQTYHDRKRTNGYTNEQIDRKRLALEGVLVPVTAEANEQMLAGVGFTVIERVWQSLNFAGWIAVKGYF